MTTGRPDRVALVTGSSRAVNGLHGDAHADHVVERIRHGGGTAHFFPGDVTSESEVADLVAAIAERLGPVDTLVVNATGPQPEARVEAVGWSDHLAQLEYFVKSPVLLGRAVLAGMRENGFGRIVHIDSEVADRPPVARSAYVVAKSAQIALARSWAHELAPFGITVNTVAPGFIPVERHAEVPAEERDAYVRTVPVGRIGTPEDVANAVSMLASTDAGFITGQRILVDGGRSLVV
jgi:3-oxoacyl-[acyl-carrier protein] reductase